MSTTKLTPENGNVNVFAKNFIKVGELVCKHIERHNETKECVQFEITDDGDSFQRLLEMYTACHELFMVDSGSNFSAYLYELLRSEITGTPAYGIILPQGKEEREASEGPGQISINADKVWHLFYQLEIISKFLVEMESLHDRIRHHMLRQEKEFFETRFMQKEVNHG